MIAVNDLLPNMMSKFNDLALFRYVIALPRVELECTQLFHRSRRSIKIAEEYNPDTLAKFTKHIGEYLARSETYGFLDVST